jgi:hypothetical protein
MLKRGIHIGILYKLDASIVNEVIVLLFLR